MVKAIIEEKHLPLLKDNGRILNKLLNEAKELVCSSFEDGITSLEVDDFVSKRMSEEGVTPSCKGYHGYQHVTCISVNDVLVHGIPDKRKFRDKDLVTIDCAINRDGFHSDKALCFSVGETTDKAFSLMSAAKCALDASIEKAVVGNTVGDIGYETMSIISDFGYTVTEKFTGHGVGERLHMLPSVPNYGSRGKGEPIVPGMCLAIEPMVIQDCEIYITDDGWTVKSFDESLCCHCEDTVYVSEEGPIVLTRG